MTDVDDRDPGRAADGRVPGRRGQATRQRLVECTADMLTSRSYRDLKVVDIAREAGTSPATFYQYFPDVEAAVLELTENLVDEARELARSCAGGWTESPDTATDRLVDGFISMWQKHQPLLRVVDLAASEGDARFRTARTNTLAQITDLLRGVIAARSVSGDGPSRDDAFATAGVVVAMMAHVSAHLPGFEESGIDGGAVRKAMRRIVMQSVAEG